MDGHLRMVTCNAIRKASQSGHLRIVEKLLEDARVNLADQNNTAIRWASRNGYFKVVERILQDSRINYDDAAWCS